MSQATASAKARRAFNSAQPTPASAASSPSISNSGVNAQGLTLPQVISIIDNRLLNLETFVKEEKAKPKTPATNANNISLSPVNDELLNEFNHRTTLLAEELASLKDIVLKLQSYTMEVNKTLYEERIHVLSDLGDLQTSENVSENADVESTPVSQENDNV